MAPGGAEASGIAPGLQDRHTRTSDRVSKPAQRPPSFGLQAGSAAIGEVLILALAFLGGLALIVLLMSLGVLPEAGEGVGAILAGPVLIAAAFACYLGAERLLSRPEGPEEPAAPLVAQSERMEGLRSLGLVPALAALALAGSAGLGWVQESLFGAEVEEQEAIVALVERGDPIEIGLLALSAVILAPITEELLFRHMFFRRLRQRAGVQLAWILPALAFALSHWNPIGLAIYVWLGLVFAYAYLSTGRIAVAIGVHACHNAIALALLLWLPPDLN